MRRRRSPRFFPASAQLRNRYILIVMNHMERRFSMFNFDYSPSVGRKLSRHTGILEVSNVSRTSFSAFARRSRKSVPRIFTTLFLAISPASITTLFGRRHRFGAPCTQIPMRECLAVSLSVFRQ